MSKPIFQPFTDRLSRDIRNNLSESLVSVLKEKTIEPSRIIAKKYLSDNLAPCYNQYIENRIRGYSSCLAKIVGGKSDPLWQSLVLWDEQLFFEVHEILEHVWLHSEGEEKLLLQAMIRAAGVYIKIDAGYGESAGKIASKAIPILEKNHQRLAQYTDPNRLVEALHHLTTPPPQLLK